MAITRKLIWNFKRTSGFSAHLLEMLMTTMPKYCPQDTLNHFKVKINLTHL